jgi:DNA mismatch repair protein MutL
MPIRKLSPLLINQIAAGEVIERPASVVKELVENSLDAGARRIDVQVEDGGRELIRIADDGGGIPADELRLALEPHATSKISEPEDLEAISTMGFRGEALASIASISRLRLTSRVPSSPEGAVIEASGDQFGQVMPAGCAPGTVIEVRNLFFNTPARRKFMRTASTEFAHISETLTRIAMARPDVGFKLTHNGRVAFDLPPGQTARQRCLAILGEEIADGLLEFESDERGIQLWGLAGMPNLARATAKFQYVFVNGRCIRDRNIAHGVKEAYRGLIEPALQPMIVLFIGMDPTLVDVNVHPAKAEVRFADSNAIHGQVLAVIRQRLLGADLTPKLAMVGGNSIAFTPIVPAGSSPLVTAGPAPEIKTTGDFVDYFRQMDPRQKGFVFDEVKREMGVSLDSPVTTDAAVATLPGAPRSTEMIKASSTPILQVHNSYIVTQDDQGIVIIDQHALHERMMFQELYERICKSGKLESQRLITPAVLEASPGRMEMLNRLQPLLEKIGVEAVPLGPTTIGIQAFATLLFDRNVEPTEFLNTLIDRAEEENFSPNDEAALHEVLDMMSCKAAVKAGDSLAPEELSELLQRRDHIERAASCPHGRPTAIRLTLHDLEKHFKRT